MAAALFAVFAPSLARAQEGTATLDQQDRDALSSTSLDTTSPADVSARESQQTAASQNQQGTTGANQQSPPSQPPGRNQAQSNRTNKEQQSIEHEEKTGTSKDRLFWLLPNFETIEEADKVPPLTVGQKFGTTARGLIDPSEFGLMTIVAGIEQASDSIPEYGQGFEGYGKRYITAYADNAVENFMANAILPSLLHQDPRYYQLGHGGFARRTFHAFSRLFITRTDSGTEQFNYSEVLGAGMAAAISDYGYHPASDQSIGNVAGVWGTQMGWDLTTYIIKEFWPDLRKKYERHHAAHIQQQ
jgi:hypothetical protein